MPKNFVLESQPALVASAERLVKSFVDWKDLSERASKAELTCLPGQSSGCCRIHQGLGRMFANMAMQATALEDRLIEAGRIEKRTIIILPQDTVGSLIIIERKDTRYSFQRFSFGWWEMVGEFFDIYTSAVKAVA